MPPDTTPPSGGTPSEPTVHVELQPANAPGFSAVVRLGGEHDLATADDIQYALRPIWGNVLVDLADCQFIDSTVISVLIRDSQRRRREGQRLELLVPPENAAVSRTLKITGLQDTIPIRPSVDLSNGSAAGHA